MRHTILLRRVVLLASLVAAGGCSGSHDGVDGGADAAIDAAGALQWYLTCGDNLCPDAAPPPSNCTAGPGDSCTTADARCEPGVGCGVGQVCADSDPKAQGCPVSQRAKKTEITYLDPAAQDALAQSVMNIRLATYSYRAAPKEQRLGFIIDDHPGDYAVLPKGDRVDLYGYTSMAVATLQAQDRRIRALEARLKQIEASACAAPTPR